MLQNLLELDKNLLIKLSQIFDEKYQILLILSSESILFWCVILLIGIWLYGTFNHKIEYKKISLKIFFLLIVVFSIYTIVNLLIDAWREHPTDFLAGNSINPLVPHPSNNSFPSGHAIFSTALVFAVFFYVKNWQIRILTLFFAILTVCARVFGGVHYVGDILGGVFFASLGAIFFKNFAEKIFEKFSPFLIKLASYLKL